jgi:hypothetical protein
MMELPVLKKTAFSVTLMSLLGFFWEMRNLIILLTSSGNGYLLCARCTQTPTRLHHSTSGWQSWKLDRQITQLTSTKTTVALTSIDFFVSLGT